MADCYLAVFLQQTLCFQRSEIGLELHIGVPTELGRGAGTELAAKRHATCALAVAGELFIIGGYDDSDGGTAALWKALASVERCATTKG